MWGTCGFPGNPHDRIIFGKLIPHTAKNLNGVLVRPLVVGDSTFPFQPWLRKPYGHTILTPKQRYFNYRLSRARMVAEEFYGQLKGRWRILLRKCKSSKEEVRASTLACMALHNICIERGETISTKLNLTVDLIANQRQDREQIRELLQIHLVEKLMPFLMPLLNNYLQKKRVVKSAKPCLSPAPLEKVCIVMATETCSYF